MEDTDPFGVPSQFDRRSKFFTGLSGFKRYGPTVLVSGDASLYVVDDIICELCPDRSLVVYTSMDTSSFSF